MDRRVSVQTGLGPLTDALSADSDFAGLYIDKLTGDIVLTALGDGDKELALASALSASHARWRFQSVAHSLSELLDVRSRIAAVEDQLEASLGLSAVGVAAITNRVTVGLDPYTESAARTIRAMYGDIVEVVSIPIASPTTCTRSDCPNPSMKGGLVISAVFNGPICTSGFGANLSSGGSSNIWYLMTAGHCLYNNGGNGIYWTHALRFPDGIYIGKSQSYLYTNHAIADVGIIKFDAWDTPTNVVYRSCGTCLTSIVARVSNAGQPLGALACFSGQSSGYPCGHIDQVQMDHVISGGWTMNNQWRIDITALSGDSGGPVLAGSNAMGILSSGATCT